MRFFNNTPKPKTLYKKEPFHVKVNRWCMRNFGYILLFLTILCLITFLIISFKIVGGSCLESGNYYNHIQECVFICLRLN